ncbi:MAG: glycerophosphodiester phosphodiesterase [Archangium sp.]|nr:glycerophosphodiester phosphodiesterase [Archangium sp.]
MRILAHRGASADFPENTLEAMRGAMEQGADGVELDVIRCGSGELVVCHDEFLDRLAGLHWDVRETPWRKLKRLDVGSRLGFAPARIPLLDEVFDLLPSSMAINVELKCIETDDRGLSLAVAERIHDRKLADRVFLSSFNPYCLVRVARAYPHLKRGYLIDPDLAWIPQAWFWLPITALTSVHPHFSQVTAERVNRWHRRGWALAVWTVDELDEARRLRALGVEDLITNRPGALRRELRNLEGA